MSQQGGGGGAGRWIERIDLSRTGILDKLAKCTKTNGY